MSGRWRYRIHNLLEIESEYELDRLAQFQVDRTGQPDIVVRAYRHGEPDGERLGDYVWEADRRLTLDLGRGIRASLQKNEEGFEFSYTSQFFRVGDPEELIQALMTQVTPSREPHLVNAAGVRDPEGRGILLFGPPQAGKTTTAIQLARQDGWALLSDEIVLVDSETVFGFPRPVRFRQDSPLYEEDVGTSRQFLNTLYESTLPAGTRRVLKHLKHRVPGVNVGGVVREAEELAPLADRASLAACVFLHPTENGSRHERIDLSEAARSAALLSDWISDHPFTNRYAYLDTEGEYEIPAVDREQMAASLANCDCYAVIAPKRQLTSVIMEGHRTWYP